MLRKSRFILPGALLSLSIWAVLPAQAANSPKNPCAANPCAAINPGAASNPYAPQNPCAVGNARKKNACARTQKNPGGGKRFTPPSGVADPAVSSKPTITQPPHFLSRKRDDSVKDAVARGRKIFRSMGCVGCHPRGRTIRGTAVDVKGVRHPVPVPTLINAAEHFPRLSPAGGVASVGQFNDWCATTFIGNPPMHPYSQEYKDLEAYVVSLSPARYERMLAWEAKRKAFMKTVQPSTGGANPGGGNAAATKISGGDSPVTRNPGTPANPCAATNPCAPMNPCAKNPCAK